MEAATVKQKKKNRIGRICRVLQSEVGFQGVRHSFGNFIGHAERVCNALRLRAYHLNRRFAKCHPQISGASLSDARTLVAQVLNYAIGVERRIADEGGEVELAAAFRVVFPAT